MIKTEFSFFQMQIKRVFRYAIKLGQASFGKAPKRLDPINMAGRVSKFILAMLDPVMLVITNIRQSIIAPPAVAVYHTFGLYFPAYTRWSVFLRASGTITVYTCPWRLKMPKTMVLPEAPRPRLPGIRRGPK